MNGLPTLPPTLPSHPNYPSPPPFPTTHSQACMHAKAVTEQVQSPPLPLTPTPCLHAEASIDNSSEHVQQPTPLCSPPLPPPPPPPLPLLPHPPSTLAQAVKVVAEQVQRHKVSTLVVDPVLVATSGDSLATSEVVQALKAHLFPLATVITPNLPEASALLGGRRVNDLESMKEVGTSTSCHVGANEKRMKMLLLMMMMMMATASAIIATIIMMGGGEGWIGEGVGGLEPSLELGG